MEKRTQNKMEKRESMLGAAFDLFEMKDNMAVSIDEIVKKAGVAKGTFYLYFQNKPDLIAKLIAKKAADFLSKEETHPDIQSEADFERYAKKYMDYLIEFLEHNKTITKLVDRNVHICVRAVLQNAEGALRDLHNKITAYFLAMGLKKEEINIKMYIYLEMIVSACCNAILRNEPAAIEEVKPHLYDIIALSRYHLRKQSEANG